MTGKEREKFLKKYCGNDAEMRNEVEKLLKSFEDSESFMQNPAIAEAASMFEEKKTRMNPKDYQQVKQIFQSVLDIAPDERAEYLNEKCSDKTAIRREVEKLLNSYESGYLEQPAIEKVAKLIEQNTTGEVNKAASWRERFWRVVIELSA